MKHLRLASLLVAADKSKDDNIHIPIQYSKSMKSCLTQALSNTPSWIDGLVRNRFQPNKRTFEIAIKGRLLEEIPI